MSIVPPSFALVLTTLAVANPNPPSSEPDARLVAAIKNSHVFKSHLKHDKIIISAQDGVVTLTGTAADDYHRALAEETAASLPTVKEVRNQLTVANPADFDSPDGKLRAKVQAALLFHRQVSALRTRVLAKDGVVTLQGEADSQAQMQRTTDCVREVDGVNQVINAMTIAPSPRKERELKRLVDDASITAQVKMALLLNRGTSALSTKVVTQEGTVTLTGKVKSRATRGLCSRIVNDIDGVKAVRNHLTVED